MPEQPRSVAMNDLANKSVTGIVSDEWAIDERLFEYEEALRAGAEYRLATERWLESMQAENGTLARNQLSYRIYEYQRTERAFREALTRTGFVR